MPSHTKSEREKNSRRNVKSILRGAPVGVPGSSNRLLEFVNSKLKVKILQKPKKK